MDESPRNPGQRAYLALIGLFCIGISLPLSGLVLGLPSTAHTEKRRLATPPAIPRSVQSWITFPAKFEAYFNDSFWLRNDLIRWYNRIRVQGLRTAPQARQGFAETGLPEEVFGNLSGRVLLGKEGWLFISGGDQLQSYRRARMLSSQQLAHWQRVFESRRDWLARRGIAYIVVTPPDKHNVYPEFVPQRVARVRESSQLDQLVDYLRTHSDIDVLDVRSALLEAKDLWPTYPRTDSHWNDFGAYVGYREILARLQLRFPQLEPWPLSAFDFQLSEGNGGDLAETLGLADLLTEQHVKMVPKERRVAKAVVRNRPEECPEVVWRVTEHPDAALPTAVVFHDSFGFKLQKLLSQHFRRVSYHLYRPFDPQIIEREQPQLVIDEISERWLLALVRKTPPRVVSEED